jgi:prolyl oligopeptidase
MNVRFLLILLGISSQLAAQSIKYPETRKTEQTDDYFGTKIDDPYRWLENDRSAETAEWVRAENNVTEKYLSAIPFRNDLKKRMTELWNFPKSSVPFKGGNAYYVYTNNGLQNQFVLNRLTDLQEKSTIFLDPNTFSTDGTINIGSVEVSGNGKYLAYSISSAGSDWSQILVKNTDNGKSQNDTINWVKFSGIAWKGNGFYYSGYDAPKPGEELKGKNEFHKVFYHLLGTPQSEDRLVFEDKEHPLRNFSATVTADERFLIISGSEGTSGNNLIVQDLQNEKSGFTTLVNDFKNDLYVIDNIGDRLLVHTNRGASNYQLVSMNAVNPGEAWQAIIPEKSEVLQEVKTGKDFIIANYLQDAKSVLKAYEMNGVFLRDLPLETIGTVDQLSANRKDDFIFYALTTFTAPTTIYKYNISTNEQQIYFRPKMRFKSEDYVTKQVFYNSYDGTRIPMFIVHHKDAILDGQRPTLLFGYGGFNISKTPEFKIERLLLLEQGGVFAMPCIRGGGEYGETWHEAGTQLKKQNVFNDFISAANYLIKENYTNNTKLGIGGRSNGGLLVGAVMTQRPDLFQVALPAVGVLDMLRYHQFTIGWAWKGDYGSSEDSVQFRYLLAYSPLHNIRAGMKYPATLVTTGDHDDRVVPAHSFKFIAALQEKYSGEQPQLIRIDVNAGHAGSTALGSSKPVAKQIEEQTDVFSFLLYNLGVDYKKQ